MKIKEYISESALSSYDDDVDILVMVVRNEADWVQFLDNIPANHGHKVVNSEGKSYFHYVTKEEILKVPYRDKIALANVLPLLKDFKRGYIDIYEETSEAVFIVLNNNRGYGS